MLTKNVGGSRLILAPAKGTVARALSDVDTFSAGALGKQLSQPLKMLAYRRLSRSHAHKVATNNINAFVYE